MRTWVGVSSVPAGFDSQAPAKAVGTLSWRVRVADVVLAAAVGSVLVGGMYFLMREIVLPLRDVLEGLPSPPGPHPPA